MSVNTINDLNGDCLSKIFQYLPVEERLIIENVCRKWKNTSKTSAWTDIKEFDCKNIKFINYHFSKGFPNLIDIKKILSRSGSVLQSLILNDNFDSKIIPIIHYYCYNLTVLQLDLDNYDDNYFINAFSTMNKLKKIKILNWKRENFENATSNDLKIFHSLNVDIENIFFQCSIMGFSQLSINFAGTLNKFNCLKYLYLENWNLEKPVMDCITKKKSLTHLSLSRSSWKNNSNELFSKLINIQYLDLSNNNDISISLTNKSFLSIINNCKKLKYLNISWCKNLTYSVLIQLKKLEYLNELLTNDTNVDGLLLSELKNLKTLECKNCYKITDNIVKKIFNNSLNIEYLNIAMTGVSSNIFTFINDFVKIRKVKLYLVADANVLENFDGINHPDGYLFVNEIPNRHYWF